jgi:hypothetical protein
MHRQEMFCHHAEQEVKRVEAIIEVRRGAAKQFSELQSIYDDFNRTEQRKMKDSTVYSRMRQTRPDHNTTGRGS